ncbi:MAG TPA: hypothetical protein VIQ74_14075 [Gemmatimonadaceae bacterium]
MRGHWSHRSLAGFMAFLLLLLVVGQGERHVCPKHDPLLAHAVAVAAEAEAAAHASAHEHMAGAHAEHDQAPQHDHARCCCTGYACTTTAVTLPASSPRIPDARIIASPLPSLPEYASAAAAPAYFIPFANGPPAPSERPA